MGLCHAGADFAAARNAEELIRAPAAGGKALCRAQKIKTVFRGAEMLRVAQYQVGLHRGAEGVHVAVGVLAGQNIFTARERIEVEIVFDEAAGQFAIARAAG